jgi:hypothetical protein
MDDMSKYLFEHDEYWMTAAQAAAYLSERSGHAVSVSYLNQLIRHGRLVPRKVGPRLNLYPYSQISTIIVERKPGPKQGPRLTNPSANALRQRAHKARRKQQQQQTPLEQASK